VAAILLAVLAVTLAAMPTTREHAFGYEHAGRYFGLKKAKANDVETWVTSPRTWHPGSAPRRGDAERDRSTVPARAA
jgi:hypothetical protein